MHEDSLLKETIEAFTSEGKKEEDVLWVGLHSCGDEKNYHWSCRTTVGQKLVLKKTSWEAFKKVADFLYDDGYGAIEVNETLIIVGDNWWLERHEYDGSEWWKFKTLPGQPSESFEIKTDDIKIE